MPTNMQMQSISGIITQVRATSGEVPPPLVGASTTVIGDNVFVFGGRLVSTRKMTNHLYILNVHTLEWIRHIPPPDSDKPPKPRYFHSASAFGKVMVVFGGMGYSQLSADGLCVLGDVSYFDVETMSWRQPEVKPSLFTPRPRYAHLSAVTDDSKLIILCGQDVENKYLEEVNILNLRTWEWVHACSIEKHIGAYRSIVVATPKGTRLPTMLKDYIGEAPVNVKTDSDAPREEKRRHQQRHQQHQQPPGQATIANERASLVRQCSGQVVQSSQEPNPLYIYSNYNFSDVKRELELIFSPASAASSIEDCSGFMTGNTLPPGLRFPTGYILGHHLILSGTFLEPHNRAYTIWSLDLGTLAWSRIETGPVFGTGSWNRSVLHEGSNRLLVFGHRARDLLEDYNHRQVNFDHMAAVDMEAFGIYKLPKTTCSSLAQEMGLSLLNEPAVSDFRIITREEQVISVNSAVLSQRWPYFADLIKRNQETTPPSKESDDQNAPATEKGVGRSNMNHVRVMIKSHCMIFPYPYAVVVALLQFIYTDNLLTAQQYQPHVLSQLLLLADMYDLARLKELTTHALHQMLNMSTAPLIFETAALSHQTSLQIRALKMMIAAKRMMMQQQHQETNRSTPTTPADNNHGNGATTRVMTLMTMNNSNSSSSRNNSNPMLESLPASPTQSQSSISSSFHQPHSLSSSRTFSTSPHSPLESPRQSIAFYDHNSPVSSPTFSPFRARASSVATISRTVYSSNMPPRASVLSTMRSESQPVITSHTGTTVRHPSMSSMGFDLANGSKDVDPVDGKAKHKPKKKKNSFFGALGSKLSISK